MVSEFNDLVDLKTARAALFPRRPNGKPVSPSTTWRWIHKGLEGRDGQRVKLKVVYVGNSPYVSRAAVGEFLREITKAKKERHRRRAATSITVTVDELRDAGLIQASTGSKSSDGLELP